MRQIRPEYEFPVEGRAWTDGELPTAGLFFLDGDCHVVARHGPAALELEERGALLVALVRFDRDGPEGGAPGASVRPLDLREAVARFAHASAGGAARPSGGARIRTALPRRGPDAGT